MKVMVEYVFIFDPSETWTSYGQLDQDFAAWLVSRGLEAEFVRTAQPQPNQVPPKKILLIKKKQMPLPAEPTPPKSIKQVKASLTRKQGYDGKFKSL